MRTVLMSCAGALLMVAAGVTAADAQMGRSTGGKAGWTGMSGQGGARAAIRSGGVGRTYVGGRGIRVAGPGFRRAGIVGPGYYSGRRFYGHRFGPRRFVRGGFYATGPYVYAGGCHRWRLVATEIGLQYRLVNVCRVPYRLMVYPYVHPYGGLRIY